MDVITYPYHNISSTKLELSGYDITVIPTLLRSPHSICIALIVSDQATQ